MGRRPGRVRFPSPQAALTVAAILLSTVWGLFLAASHLEGRASVLDRIEAPLVDLRFVLAGARPAPRDVVVVAVDDATVREVGAYPLPRATMARIVRELGRHGPKAVAIDVLFLEPGPPEGDAALAAALAGTRAVIAAAGLFARDDGRGPEAPNPVDAAAPLPTATRVLWPTETVSRAAAVGLVNVATDHAGTPRHVPLLLRDGSGGAGEGLLPSFALRTASVAAGADPVFGPDEVRIGAAATPLDLGSTLPLRFYGGRGTVATISAGRLLRGEVPDEAIRGRVAVIGATAVGTGDTFATPFDLVLPGVEVLATAIAHLTTGDGLVRTRATRGVDAAATVVLPVVAIALVALRRRIGVGLALAGLVGLAWAALAVVAFVHWGLWLQMSVPLAGVVVPGTLYAAARLWLDQRIERGHEATEAALRRFHAPALADHLAATPDYLAEPVGQRAAVLFVDLSGFTGQSERLGPERTQVLLKELHTLIEEEVTRQGGLVLNYMGDGAMIVFGVPEARPDDPARALAAVVALAGRIEDWLAALPRESRGAMGVRVGAHYGPVVVSRLGADTHQQITATGDSVNVASRLLEVAAQNRATAAISSDLDEAAAAQSPALDRADLRSPQAVAIRGRAQPLRVRLWRPGADPV